MTFESPFQTKLFYDSMISVRDQTMSTAWRDQLGLSSLTPRALLIRVVNFCGVFFLPLLTHARRGKGKAKGLVDGAWPEAQTSLPWAGSCVSITDPSAINFL